MGQDWLKFEGNHSWGRMAMRKIVEGRGRKGGKLEVKNIQVTGERKWFIHSGKFDFSLALQTYINNSHHE